MSIVETAVKKAQQANAAKQPLPQQSSSHAVTAQRRSNVESTPAKLATQFQTTTLDSEALRLNHVLPQISDQVALQGYKILRTRTLQRLQANNWHSIAVTGTEPGQGKTLTAINLAIALAQDPNTSVFLVDADLRRPQVAARLGLKGGRGLGDYLMGEVEADEIIYDPGIKRLAVVPNFQSFEHSSELLAGTRMLEFISALDVHSPRRIVIYDLPPLLLADDVIAFAPHVDGVMVVLSEGGTSRASVEKSKELLAEMNVIGVVLNHSAERETKHYY